MPYPFEYGVASQTFQEVLEAVRAETAVSTKYQAFTVLESVLRAFRRRISVQDSVRFADLLPVAVRALYVHDWNVDERRSTFADPLDLADEVRSFRHPHNSAPDTAIDDVARALRMFVVENDLDEMLVALPDGAVRFWRG